MEGAQETANLAELLQIMRDAHQQDYIGEPISQLEHALQCAKFASDAGTPCSSSCNIVKFSLQEQNQKQSWRHSSMILAIFALGISRSEKSLVSL